jgi:hypothetical protein
MNGIDLHYLLSQVALVSISPHQDGAMLILYCKQMT